jgi:hypothetical protein
MRTDIPWRRSCTSSSLFPWPLCETDEKDGTLFWRWLLKRGWRGCDRYILCFPPNVRRKISAQERGGDS